MNLKREILQILIGAVLLSLFITTGILSPANGFLENLLTSIVMFLVTRLVSIIIAH